VLASRDARAAEASRALSGFRYDSAGFALVNVGRSLAVEFVAAGRGERAGGLVLPLDPIAVPEPAWWREVRETLPASGKDSAVDRWEHRGFAVLARYDSTGAVARVTIVDSAGRRWPVGVVSAPTRSIFWLDGADVDSATVRSLARAFDEAALYSEQTRTTLAPPRAPAAAAHLARSVPARRAAHRREQDQEPQMNADERRWPLRGNARVAPGARRAARPWRQQQRL
jgi:hypothetical protein